MKLTEFTYTKPNGEVTQRAIIITKEFSKTVAGYDITSLLVDEESLQKIVNDYNDLETKILVMRNEFWAKHSAGDKYREFLPERMANVTDHYYTSQA